ncbi:transcription antitermination factor NusB [bacterium]|nr:transcription antitermination factor NusB [bacterium]
MAFLPEFCHFIATEHNPSDYKFKTTEDDKKVFELIAENKFVEEIQSDPDLKRYLDKPVIRWADEKDMMFMMYKIIKKHDHFIEIKESTDEDRDFSFGKFLYKYLIKESVEFEQMMEEKNIVWYDEKIPILKNLERLFEHYEKSGEIKIPELSKDLDEDLEFAEQLIEQYLKNKGELVETINENTPGWDSERITKIDFVLMCMALCEFKYMPYVPVKVTINEYIEIAKMYSTPQSSKFVNGTLDKILKEWQNEGLINKSGRGLIG